MRVALLGRTRTLLETGRAVVKHGHEVVLVATGRATTADGSRVEDFRLASEHWGSGFLESADISQLAPAMLAGSPDVALSVNYPLILGSDVVDVPRLGVLNAHGGDLPRYRGNACQAWAIINGENRVGLCIHRMVADKVDDGDILSRRHLPIDDSTKVAAILRWMEAEIPGLFLESIDQLTADPTFVLERQSSDPMDSLRCFPRRPEDGRIDWSADSRSIVRLVNASGEPYDGAFCFFGELRVTIMTAEVADDVPPYLAVPGQVIGISDVATTVACGQGAIRILDASIEGCSDALQKIVRSTRSRLS